MPLAARQKANTGNPVTVFQQLKTDYALRLVKRKSPPLQSKPLKNKQSISDFLEFYKNAEKFTWHKQPWYIGTGLHYSSKCTIYPLAKQVCSGGYNNADYQNTMLFDQPIDADLLKGITSFPLVRCKITTLLGNINGGLADENFLWHRDERSHEVLRIIVPLETDDVYQFQLDNYKPINLETGMIYAFDQHILHRIFKKTATSVNRTHLILSLVTWFDKKNDQWIPNKYAGKIHPMDLFDQINL